MCCPDVAFSRSAHDVVEHGRELEDLEAVLREISIAADVAIVEAKQVAKFMRERSRGQIAGRQGDVPSDEAMSRLGARC